MEKLRLASAACKTSEAHASKGDQRTTGRLWNESHEAADFAPTKRAGMNVPIGFVGEECGHKCGFSARGSRRALCCGIGRVPGRRGCHIIRVAVRPARDT